MSQAKMDRVSRLSEPKKIEAEIMEGIVRHLRKIGGVNTSAIKRIARETGTNPRTVKAWYEGRNMPSLLGYIHLARCYPELIELFLNQCQLRSSMSPPKPSKVSRSSAVSGAAKVFTTGVNAAENVGNDVGNRVGTMDCNTRQLWFMLRIEEGAVATAEALADCWRVSIRTAERDIAELQKQKLVSYCGTRRRGQYLLTGSEL